MTELRRRMMEDLQLAGYHPHVHMLVPAGGLDKDGEWKESRKKYLVPVEALSKGFRYRFMKMARKALPKESFIVPQKDNIRYKNPYGNGSGPKTV